MDEVEMTEEGSECAVKENGMDLGGNNKWMIERCHPPPTHPSTHPN